MKPSLTVLVLLVALAACQAPTEPSAKPLAALSPDTVYLSVNCSFPTVWELGLDGLKTSLIAVVATDTTVMLRLPASPGQHVLDWTRWAPSISSHSGPLDSVPTGAKVALPCSPPDRLHISG